MYLRRIFTTIAALVLILGSSGQRAWAVQEEPAQKQVLEQAVGPKAFLSLEEQGKLTIRALLAWSSLPPEFMDLASSLRREQGLDLLGADIEVVKEWIAKAEQGEQGLSAHGQALQALAVYMQSRARGQKRQGIRFADQWARGGPASGNCPPDYLQSGRPGCGLFHHNE